MKLLVLAILGLLLLFASGSWQAEGTVKGAAIGGALAVKVKSRSMALACHGYRPNRTYYYLLAKGE